MTRRTWCVLVLVAACTFAAQIGRSEAASSTAGSSSAPAAPRTPDPVADCPAGLVCFTISEQAQIDRRLAEFDRMRARRHLLGWHGGCGLGVAAIVTADVDVKGAPAGICGVIFGW